MTGKKATITKGSMVFAMLSLAVMIGILLWTTEADTWSHFAEFQWTLIPLLLGLGSLRWFLDGMAFVSMAKHSAHASLGIWQAMKIRLMGNFVGSVLPVLLGTVSMHAYLLHKAKLKLSESIAITALRAFLPVFIFLFNLPIYYYLKSDMGGDKFFSQLIKVISPPLALIVFFLVITLFYPQRIKKVASSLLRLWGRVKFVHVNRMIELEDRFFHEIDQFSKIFWIYLRRRKGTLLFATMWILLAFTAEYLIAMVILWGFGFHPSVIKVLAFQCLMKPIIYFSPTPGGAGIWEFTYLGFFSLFMGKNLIGVSVLFWRIVVTYIPAIFGGILLTHNLHRDSKMRDIMGEKVDFKKADLIEKSDS